MFFLFFFNYLRKLNLEKINFREQKSDRLYQHKYDIKIISDITEPAQHFPEEHFLLMDLRAIILQQLKNESTQASIYCKCLL